MRRRAISNFSIFPFLSPATSTFGTSYAWWGFLRPNGAQPVSGFCQAPDQARKVFSFAVFRLGSALGSQHAAVHVAWDHDCGWLGLPDDLLNSQARICTRSQSVEQGTDPANLAQGRANRPAYGMSQAMMRRAANTGNNPGIGERFQCIDVNQPLEYHLCDHKSGPTPAQYCRKLFSLTRDPCLVQIVKGPKRQNDRQVAPPLFPPTNFFRYCTWNKQISCLTPGSAFSLYPKTCLSAADPLPPLQLFHPTSKMPKIPTSYRTDIYDSEALHWRYHARLRQIGRHNAADLHSTDC